jgi:hypothetical protein
MLPDFSTEYAQRSDDELLHLATQQHSLTPEAVSALDAELRRRRLTESDRVEHQRFVKRQEQRETRKHGRKRFGPFKYQLSWPDILGAFGTMALISFAYISLPSRFHFIKPDWQDATFIAMMTAVVIAAGCRKAFWRKFAFWISLGISSAIHLFAIHRLTQRVGEFSRGAAKGAAVLGFLLFFAIYGLVRLLQRAFNNEEVLTAQGGDGHVPE